MRVRVLSSRVTFGSVGDEVEVPDGVNVNALLRSFLVEAVPEPEPVKAAAKKKGR